MKQKAIFLAIAVVGLTSSIFVVSDMDISQGRANVIDAVQSDQTIAGVVLIDAETDEVLGEFVDGITLNIAGNKKFTMGVITDPTVIGSVKFQIDGEKRSDNKYPYVFYRDSGLGNYYPADLETGTHALVITPFTETRVRGFAGESAVMSFSVINDQSKPAVIYPTVEIPSKLIVFLGGSYDANSNKMLTGLNDANLIPLIEPYTALGEGPLSGAGSTISETLLEGLADSAIVDWVIIELRDSIDPTVVIDSRPALLEADGEVKSVDGVTPILDVFTPGEYFVAIHHRNHLPVMTASPHDIQGIIDLSLEPLHGDNAAKVISGVQVLWPGDVTGNEIIKYSGSGNDRDAILTSVGSSTPNRIVTDTYSRADLNLDGKIKYTGSDNDRDVVLQSVGVNNPSNARSAELPD
jgi:hypothetical protein